ncbi:MAG: hypothetical protein HQL50_14915 [Magnetococcales bacterium]|nr:hypothetical protein [Magnetococcales bacterium]
MSKSYRRKQREQMAAEWPLGKRVEALEEALDLLFPIPGGPQMPNRFKRLIKAKRKAERDHPKRSAS